MTKILAISMAAMAALAVAQSAQAKDHDSDMIRGKAAAAPQARVAASPNISHQRTMTQAPTVSRQRTMAPSVAGTTQFRSSSTTNPQFRARTGTTTTTSPTVAFGGTDRRFRSGGSTREFRSDTRSFSPTWDVSRSWDHNRIYTWNNHRYHWYGGDWVILDSDLGVDYAPSYSTYSADVVDPDSLAADVQARLASRGYNPGPVDGVIGAQTRDAIADFQADHGLPVTGHINNSLLRSLGM